MHSASYFISPNDLWNLIGTAQAPQIVDARRRDAYDAAPGVLPTASWADAKTGDWIGSIDRTRPVVVACKAAHEMSQMAAAELRARGYDAAVLAGGYARLERGQAAAGQQGRARSLRAEAAKPLGDAAAAEDRPRRLPVADPALHRRRRAHPVRRSARGAGGRARKPARSRSTSKASRFRTRARAAPSTPCSSCSGWRTSRRSNRLALIVRGADTARPDLAPEAAGLHAVSLGLSALAGDDDHGLLQQGFMVYDALFAYLRFAAQERHNWPAKVA